MDARNNFDHYVAQHFLKLFMREGTIHVGDITNGTVSDHTSTERIFGEVNWSVDQSFEDLFTSIEAPVAKALKCVSQTPESITGLSPATLQHILEFITLHYGRSPAIHESSVQSNSKFENVVRDMAPTEEAANNFSIPAPDRIYSLTLGMQIAQDLRPALLMKGCVALLAPHGSTFLTGDNPVARLSSQEHYYMRGAVFGYETYFWVPLTPEVGLIFIDGIDAPLGSGALKRIYASKKVSKMLNHALVWSCYRHIAGSFKGAVRLATRWPNVGEERNSVQRFGYSPLVINTNNAVYRMNRSLLDDIISRFPENTPRRDAYLGPREVTNTG